VGKVVGKDWCIATFNCGGGLYHVTLACLHTAPIEEIESRIRKHLVDLGDRPLTDVKTYPDGADVPGAPLGPLGMYDLVNKAVGSVTHLTLPGKNTALCGRKPTKTHRNVWTLRCRAPHPWGAQPRTCSKCLKGHEMREADGNENQD
jgi:hypothetical protein